MRAGYVIALALLSAWCALSVVACDRVCKDAPNTAVFAACAR